MPTYDYRCTVCDNRFEHFQSMFDEPLKICPKCNSAVKRVISGGSGLIFKGSGFYITDYKNKKSNNNSASKKPDMKSSKVEKKAVKPVQTAKKD